MANASAKRIANQNEATVKQLRLGLFIPILISLVLRFLFRRHTLPPSKSILALYVLTYFPAFFLSNYLIKIGTTRRDPQTGALISYGEDLGQTGVTEWCFDILYITWACQVGSGAFGDWFWWLYLVIPLYAVFKLWTSVISPMVLGRDRRVVQLAPSTVEFYLGASHGQFPARVTVRGWMACHVPNVIGTRLSNSFLVFPPLFFVLSSSLFYTQHPQLASIYKPMVFHEEPEEEGGNVLSVYLSGPCFGDATPPESPVASPCQNGLLGQQKDNGSVAPVAQHDTTHRHMGPLNSNGDKDEKPRFDAELHNSWRSPTPRVEALIDVGSNTGAYHNSAPRPTQFHAHEDLVGLSFKPRAQQNMQQFQGHEALAGTAFDERPLLQRRTPGKLGCLENAPNAPGGQLNVPQGAERNLDSEETSGYQSGDEGYSSSPYISGDPLYEAEVDELTEEYAEIGNCQIGSPWPNSGWRNTGSEFPSSSPPQFSSSPPAAASSQTSFNTDVDEDLFVFGKNDGDPGLQRLSLFLLKDQLGQMDKTEMKSSDFQNNAETHPEFLFLTRDASLPRLPTVGQDAFGADSELRGEVARDDVQMDETRFLPDAAVDPDLDDELKETRGVVLPLDSSVHNSALVQPILLHVVAPLARVEPTLAQAPRSQDGDDDDEKPRGMVSPQISSPRAAGQDAVHPESSPIQVDDSHMPYGGPVYGSQQADEAENEAHGMRPPSNSIPGDRCPSVGEPIEYGRHLDNDLGWGGKDTILFDPKRTAPVEGCDASLVRGELSVSERTECPWVVCTQASEMTPHHATDDTGQGPTDHVLENAPVKCMDTREDEYTSFVGSPGTEHDGYSAGQSALRFPAAERALEETTALVHDEAENDDSQVLDGYQEPQGLDSVNATLPDLTYRSGGKAQGKPGTQEGPSDPRSLKRRGWDAAAAAKEREPPRHSAYPLPNPKRTTAAGQLLQRKKLSKPFKCPAITNRTSAKGTAACESQGNHPLTPVKQGDQAESFPHVAVLLSPKQDTKIKHRTPRAGAQFKSPLTIRPSGRQVLIKPTPTIQTLERQIQTLKRAARVIEDREEETLQALIAKWTEAGREVAYELWTIVKDSGGGGNGFGTSMGGEDPRKRKFEESWGWDDGTERQNLRMGRGSSWGLSPALEGDAEHVEREEHRDASEEHDGGDGVERVLQETTIGTMLLELGVCPMALGFGWDEEGCHFAG